MVCADEGPAEPVAARAAARADGIEVEVVVVWTGPDPSPHLGDGIVVRAFPAGRAHARNRGARATGAPVVAFLDAGASARPGWARAVQEAVADGAGAVIVGELLAVRRDPLVELGGFDVRLGPGAFGRAAEDLELLERLKEKGWPVVGVAGSIAAPFDAGFGAGRVTRRLASMGVAARFAVGLRDRPAVAAGRALAGLAAGALLPDRWRSPSRLLALAPPAAREALGARPLRAWPVPHRPDPHFLWAAGDDLVLHVYAEAPDDPHGALAARRAARAAGAPWVPSVHAAAEGHGAWWVVEERLRGRTASTVGAWWPHTADWATALAAAAVGGPVRDTAWWRAVAEADPSGLEAALDRAGALAAVPVHGDLQAKNVLLDRSGRLAAVLDWEGAFTGPAGLDLLFLVLAARPPGDRPAAVGALRAGRDPAGTPVLARLERAGVDPVVVPHLLTLALVLWTADERRRRRRLGAPPPPVTDQGLAPPR